MNASSQRALSIGRANLDGTDVTKNFITDLGAPCDLSTAIGCGWGLAVDGQYLYWPNYALQTIGRANVDGSNVNQSFITGANYPLGLALSAPTEPVCLQAASAPPPPLGGASVRPAFGPGKLGRKRRRASRRAQVGKRRTRARASLGEHRM